MKFDDEWRFGPNIGNASPRTAVECSAEYESTAEELLRNLDGIRQSAEYRILCAQQAAKIIRDKRAVAYLMSKARVNSDYTERSGDAAAEMMSTLRAQLAGWISLRRLLTFDDNWLEQAVCRNRDPELFFGLTDTMSAKEAERARAVCNDCAVRLQCLTWAMDRGERFGMWGGRTETERRDPATRNSLARMVKLVMR